MFGSALALALFASIATVSAHCYIRLVNDLVNDATIYDSSGAVATAIGGSVAAYATVPCAANFNLSTSTGGNSTSVPFSLPSDAPTSHFSAFAYCKDPCVSPSVRVTLLQDWETSYTDDEGVNRIDAAQLRVVHSLLEPVHIFGVATECFNCKLPQLTTEPLEPGAAWVFERAASTYPYNFSARSAASGVQLAEFVFSMEEHGAYTLVLRNGVGAALLEDVPGRNAHLPLLYAALLLAAAGALHKCMGAALVAAYHGREPPLPAPAGQVTLLSFFGWDKVLARAAAAAKPEGTAAEPRFFAESGGNDMRAALLQSEGSGSGGALLSPAGSLQQDPTPLKEGGAPRGSQKKERLHSLDAFRGFSLTIMIFVNAGGGGYAYLDHSKWNGLTVADLVFPWFVFMSGVSFAFSSASERKRGATARALVWKAAVRSCKLFLLGLLVVNGPSYLPELRVPSVLSYFASATLVLGLVDALVPVGALPEAAPTSMGAALYVDFGRYAAQWAAMLALGAVYLLVSFFLPVPGCPTGYLGPGGLADQGAHPACTGGAHGYVDRLLWGPAHIYGGATCRDVYNCVEVKYDPENTLGAISAAWMAWLGLHVGRALVAQQALSGGQPARALTRAVTPRWLAAGLTLCLIAGLLCGFSKEGGVIPVNKNMWSPSFVALLAGFGCINLVLFFNVVDVLKWWSGAPFRYAGANPLAVYLASEVFSDNFPLQWSYSVKTLGENGWSSHSEKLLCNVLNVIFLVALARYWHLKRWSWNV